MLKKAVLFASLILITSLKIPLAADLSDICNFEKALKDLYDSAELQHKLDYEIFRYALICKINLENRLTNKDLITIIDYNKPSYMKRFFVIDIKNQDLLFETYVAHGENSGNSLPCVFSNKLNSKMSCLGFFITAETYSGKHGHSMRLDGVEDINSNARIRGIVLHGADYVGEKLVSKNGDIGKSGGCPALPSDITGRIIEIIKNHSCLLIYHNSLLSASCAEIYDPEKAVNIFKKNNNLLF